MRLYKPILFCEGLHSVCFGENIHSTTSPVQLHNLVLTILQQCMSIKVLTGKYALIKTIHILHLATFANIRVKVTGCLVLVNGKFCPLEN